MSNTFTIQSALWRTESLGDCLAALLGKAEPLTAGIPDPACMELWMHRAALELGCEAVAVAATYRDLEQDLSGLYPSILRLENGFLAIAREKHGRIRLLCPDSSVLDAPTRSVCDAIRSPLTKHRRAGIEELLTRCGVSDKSRTEAADALVSDHLGWQAVGGAWLFTEPCDTPASEWMKEAGAIPKSILLLGTHLASYVLWLLAWVIIGSLSLSGHLDRSWLFGWGLLIASVVLCRVFGTWLQGRMTIGVAGLLKSRLLAGVLRLGPEELRHQGIGSFLGQTFEAESLEKLALGGGISGLLAILDLVLAGFILGRFAVVLGLWAIVTFFLARRFLHGYERWTSSRMSLTRDLVESMVGHRTRLAQEPADSWHEGEDRALNDYYHHSEKIDRIACILISAIPRGWLLLGLGCVATGVITGEAAATRTAVLLGGVLLAWNAFERLAGSATEITAALVACKRVGNLFCAAARKESAGIASPKSPKHKSVGQTLIEADRLTFRYRSNSPPVLDNCRLAVRSGDRILLEGPSGGGKTTLASILAGARQPDAGLVLAGGLDLQTLGRESWRKYVVLVPQFHENHILTETLAFNLLCGRAWPPTARDVQDAEDVCRGLGLGPLLDRMPAGLMQMVGEGGWQLSHGERSRVFIARAMLQDAALMIVDEGFGALDPENLQSALKFTRDTANALMVIAHP